MSATSTINPKDTGRCIFKHALCHAEMHLNGAHITHWQPTGHEPVLFVSPNAIFEPGKPIRGGIPICLPWFGPHPTDPNAPAHGVVRTQMWQLVQDKADDVGWHLHLRCEQSQPAGAYWTHPFTADFHVSFGTDLAMELQITNTGKAAFDFSEALHTYYHVSDVREITVAGLHNTEYLDKPDGMKRKTEMPPAIEFTEETDRVYINTPATCVITDPKLKRRIIVEKQHSLTTVVWNPFEARASQLPDLGSGNWPGFVCVETANSADNTLTLGPGKTHAMSAKIRIEPITP